MYVWVWRHLPGGWPGKLLGSLILLVGVLALLFLVVFPWASPKLPFNHITVDGSTPSAPPASHATATPN